MIQPHLDTVNEAAAWIGPELRDRMDWILHLNDIELKEIDDALENIKAKNISIPFLKSDFLLPTLSKKITSLYDILENGLGFSLVRGIPRDKYSNEECEIIYWGIGIHLGTPVSQNTRGHLLGHVTDEGRKISDPNTRMYQTKLKMEPF